MEILSNIIEVVREWWRPYLHPRRLRSYRRLMKALSHVRAGRKFTRHEMNAR